MQKSNSHIRVHVSNFPLLIYLYRGELIENAVASNIGKSSIRVCVCCIQMLLIRIDYQGNNTTHTHTLITPSKVCHKIKFNYCSISALRKGKLCGKRGGAKVNQKLNEQLVKDNSRCPQLAPRFYYTLSRQRNRWKINTPRKTEGERRRLWEHCEATIRQREATWIGVCRKARLGHITPPMAEIRRRRCHSKINFKSLNEMNLKKERKRLRERRGRESGSWQICCEC